LLLAVLTANHSGTPTERGAQLPMAEAPPTSRRAPLAFSTLGISWPLLIAFCVAASVLGVRKIDVLADPDTFWHIAAGDWMLAHGTVPKVDVFSHSMPGAVWHAHEWLAEVLFSALYQSAGWAGLGGLVALTFAGTLAYLMRFLLARMQPVHALLFTVYAGCMLAANVLVRPHVLAWPLMALWVGTLVGASEQGRSPPWWLLALMVLLANLHGASSSAWGWARVWRWTPACSSQSGSGAPPLGDGAASWCWPWPRLWSTPRLGRASCIRCK
jgi:hypothetical protein